MNKKELNVIRGGAPPKIELLKEAVRRVIQIIVGIFIFDFPVLNKSRNIVLKVILEQFGMTNVISGKVKFYVPHGLVKAAVIVGNFVRISENVTIDCSSAVTIEDNVWISQNTEILNHKHSIGKELKNSKKIELTEGIILGKDCWIGSNATILPNVNYIGKGAVVGAGSIVTKNVEDYWVVAGNPAKKIGIRE